MGKLAFVFPGQGSQYIGMGKDLYENLPVCRDIMDKINNLSNNSLLEKVFSGTESILKNTEITQPAIYMVSLSRSSVENPCFLKKRLNIIYPNKKALAKSSPYQRMPKLSLNFISQGSTSQVILWMNMVCQFKMSIKLTKILIL